MMNKTSTFFFYFCVNGEGVKTRFEFEFLTLHVFFLLDKHEVDLSMYNYTFKFWNVMFANHTGRTKLKPSIIQYLLKTRNDSGMREYSIFMLWHMVQVLLMLITKETKKFKLIFSVLSATEEGRWGEKCDVKIKKKEKNRHLFKVYLM